LAIRQFSRSRIRATEPRLHDDRAARGARLIVILASMGMLSTGQSVVHAKEAVLKTDFAKLRDAIDQ
jgi:hypothetical protein